MCLDSEVHSCFSPSPVSGEELIRRFGFVPQEIGSDGSVLPEAIQLQDLSDLSRGWSTQRLSLLSDDRAATLVARRSKALVATLDLIVDSVRTLADDEGRQAFVVFASADDADDVAHATIFFARQYPPSVKKALRFELLQVLPKWTRLDQVPGGEVAQQA